MILSSPLLFTGIVDEGYMHQLEASLFKSAGPRGGLIHWHRTMFIPFMAFHSLSPSPPSSAAAARAGAAAGTGGARPPPTVFPGCTRLYDLCWAASMLCSLEQAGCGGCGGAAQWFTSPVKVRETPLSVTYPVVNMMCGYEQYIIC